VIARVKEIIAIEKQCEEICLCDEIQKPLIRNTVIAILIIAKIIFALVVASLVF